VYPVIAELPLLPGTINVIVAFSKPAAADTPVGAPGAVTELDGVTVFEAELAGPIPIAFVAVTVKEYSFPLTIPVTVIGLADPVPLNPPGLEVTVYPVIADPPSLAGAVNVTVAWASPFTADTPVGAPGAVKEAEGVTEFDVALEGPVPLALVEVTVNV